MAVDVEVQAAIDAAAEAFTANLAQTIANAAGSTAGARTGTANAGVEQSQTASDTSAKQDINTAEGQDRGVFVDSNMSALNQKLLSDTSMDWHNNASRHSELLWANGFLNHQRQMEQLFQAGMSEVRALQDDTHAENQRTIRSGELASSRTWNPGTDLRISGESDANLSVLLANLGAILAKLSQTMEPAGAAKSGQ